MLEVYDTERDHSYSYIHHPLEGSDFEATFTFLPSLLKRDVCFLRVSGSVDLFTLYAGKDGEIKLRSANLSLYPGSYPSYLSYPSTRSTYPTQTVGVYPSHSKLESTIIPRSSSAIEMSLYFSRSELEGRVEVYASPLDSPSNSVFHGSLRWAHSPISRFDLGCISARETPYNLKFSNLEVRGEVSEGNWYYISGFDGFRSVPDTRWQGAVDPYDDSSYTSYTDLRNLARYDYARPENPVNEAYGINWKI